MNLQALTQSSMAMSAAINPVLLLLASILLSGVMMLTIYGIAELFNRYRRQRSDETKGMEWPEDSAIQIARDHDSLVAPGK